MVYVLAECKKKKKRERHSEWNSVVILLSISTSEMKISYLKIKTPMNAKVAIHALRLGKEQ